MNVTTSRFGTMDVDPNKIITIPNGMLGFPEQRFVLITPLDHGPFSWLQAIDNADLAFVVIDLKANFPEYEVKLTREEVDRLDLQSDCEALVLGVVTMSAEPSNVTVNLLGPLVLNPGTMLAEQIVLEAGKYTTRHPLRPGKV